MKKSLLIKGLIFISLLFLSPTIYSQNKFSSGFIVLSHGDTLQGFIKEGSHADYARKVTFARTSAAEETEDYLPGQLDAFYIEGTGFFKSKKVSYVEKTQDPTSQISGVSSSSLTVEDADKFLMVLESGMATLYYFRSESDNIHYFIEKPGMDITELRQVKRIIHGKNDISLHQKDLYSGVLKYTFQDCKTVPEGTVSFKQKSLANAVRDYNDCMREQNEYEKLTGVPEIHFSQARIEWQFGIMGGYSMIWYIPDNNDPNKDLYSTTNAFSGGAFGALRPADWNRKIWLEFRVLYSPKGYEIDAYSEPPAVPGLPPVHHPGAKELHHSILFGGFFRYEANPYGFINPFLCTGLSIGGYIIPEIDLGVNFNTKNITPFIMVRNEFVGAVPFLKYYVLNFSAGIKF